MANGLTSSDIFRQQSGFGVAPDTESRKRAAAAGKSPLTTSERIRQSWGWGASEFASPESRSAFQAAEVIGRGGPTEQMPFEYGGMPTGTTRRAIRQRAAWMQEQQAIAQIAEERRKQAEEARNIETTGLAIEKERYDFNTKKEADNATAREDAQVSLEQDRIVAGLNSIDLKEDPDAGYKIENLINENPLGATKGEIALKRIEASKNIFTTYGIAARNKADQSKREAKTNIVNEALKSGVTPAEIEATRFVDQATGNVDYNYEEIAKLGAQREGERKTKEPEEKEGYVPMSITEAQDRYDIAKSELDAFDASIEAGEINDDDPDYVKAQARLRRAEAQLNVSKLRETGAAPQERQPTKQTEKSEQKTTSPIRVTSKEEFDKLASGTEYVAPNGKRYIKK